MRKDIQNTSQIFVIRFNRYKMTFSNFCKVSNFQFLYFNWQQLLEHYLSQANFEQHLPRGLYLYRKVIFHALISHQKHSYQSTLGGPLSHLSQLGFSQAFQKTFFQWFMQEGPLTSNCLGNCQCLSHCSASAGVQ